MIYYSIIIIDMFYMSMYLFNYIMFTSRSVARRLSYIYYILSIDILFIYYIYYILHVLHILHIIGELIAIGINSY